MSSLDAYCPACGAANSSGATACFACGRSFTEDGAVQDEVTVVLPDALLQDRYRILYLVGEGGFAKVYKAEDTLYKRIVAIKSIGLQELTPQQIIDATDTYNREINFGTQLKHPHLPTMYEAFTDQEHWYIVSEFIDGKTLEEYMQRKPGKRLPFWEVLEIGVQVCETLAYLHSRQPPIIFRDIKPDNIMRTESGYIYLVDFGIARQLKPGLRRDTQSLGSPGYAAPEQYGSAQTNERSDIYSLGVTLRTLLTGADPLLPAAPAVPGDKVVQELNALLDHMCQRNQEDRPADMEEVKQALQRIARDSGIMLKLPGLHSAQVPPPTPVVPKPAAFPQAPAPAPKRNARRPLWYTAAIAMLLLLVGGTVFGPALFANFIHPLHFLPIQGKPVRAAQQTLNIGLGTMPDYNQLDPRQAYDEQSLQMVNMLYAGLTTVDDKMQVRPALAASWDEQPAGAGLSWTFHLRPNLRFSDGTPLTSTDVAYSLDRAFDPNASGAVDLNMLKDVSKRSSGSLPTLIGDSILTPDAQTLVIVTVNRDVFLPAALTQSGLLIVEKSLITKYGQAFPKHLDEGGCTGPFMVSIHTDQRVDLVPNPDYFGARPVLTRVSLVGFSDSALAYAAYKAGQVGMVELQSDQVQAAQGDSGFHRTPELWMHYYAMNYLTKPFNNSKIRRAFALALNKDLLTKMVQNGAIPTNHLIPFGEAAYNPELQGLDGSVTRDDTTLAKSLLQQGLREEGYASVQQLPPITLTFSKSGSLPEVEAAQQMWLSVLGIHVQLKSISLLDLLKQVDASMHNAHGLQMWRLDGSAYYPDASQWTTALFDRSASGNQMNYGQNQSDTVAEQQATQVRMEQADEIQNTTFRTQAYRAIEQQLVNDVAYLPLYQRAANYLVNPKIVGLQLNSMDVVSQDDWARVVVTQ